MYVTGFWVLKPPAILSVLHLLLPVRDWALSCCSNHQLPPFHHHELWPSKTASPNKLSSKSFWSQQKESSKYIRNSFLYFQGFHTLRWAAQTHERAESHTPSGVTPRALTSRTLMLPVRVQQHGDRHAHILGSSCYNHISPKCFNSLKKKYSLFKCMTNTKKQMKHLKSRLKCSLKMSN